MISKLVRKDVENMFYEGILPG